jgi:hypothetical protein
MRGVTSSAGTGRAQQSARQQLLARQVVDRLGGRYSAELGIDVDAGDAEVERWFVAATLFGTRIAAAVAERTFGVLSRAGLARIGQVRHIPTEGLMTCLDEGGYTRYDFRTADRLQALSEVIGERYGGQAAVIGQTFTTYPELRQALDALPGWGPVTIELFLRELRGVWPGAQPPLDQRAASGASHLGLGGRAQPDFPRLAQLADQCHIDPRDLESGLVRLTLAHHRGMASCAGGHRCNALAPVGQPEEG